MSSRTGASVAPPDATLPSTCLSQTERGGENEHAPGEYVELGEMPRLAERAALLIYRLTR